MVRLLAAVALGAIIGTWYTAARFFGDRARELVETGPTGGRTVVMPAPAGARLASCSECGGWHPTGERADSCVVGCGA